MFLLGEKGLAVEVAVGDVLVVDCGFRFSAFDDDHLVALFQLRDAFYVILELALPSLGGVLGNFSAVIGKLFDNFGL